MKFKMVHENYNVSDLGKSMEFYEKALGLTEKRRINGNGFIIVYLGNESSDFELELTWLEDTPSAMIWASASSIWHSAQTISRPPTSCTKRWAVSATKTPTWGSILSPIPTATGWKWFPPEDDRDRRILDGEKRVWDAYRQRKIRTSTS